MKSQPLSHGSMVANGVRTRPVTKDFGAAWLGGLLFVFLAPGVANADKPETSKTSLHEMATHIAVGKITAIYRREESTRDQRHTWYVAEVKLESVDKGDGLQPGGLAYVRYWQSEWIGDGSPPPDSESRYSVSPRKKQRLRIYLTKNAYDGAGENNDGGLNVIFKNGFEPLADQS